MLARISTICVVLFWVVMMGLLLRTDVFKRQLMVLDLPPEHVLKLMFIHLQDSRLEFRQDGETIGSFSLNPTKNEGENRDSPYRLVFNGNFLIPGENQKPQRVTVDGITDFSPELELNWMRIVGGIREHGMEAIFDLDRATETFKLKLSRAGELVQEWEGKLADIEKMPELTESGISSEQLERIKSQVSEPEIRATKGEIRIKGQPVDAYVLIIKHAESIESMVFLSQLGQILKVQLFTGQVMVADGVDVW